MILDERRWINSITIIIIILDCRRSNSCCLRDLLINSRCVLTGSDGKTYLSMLTGGGRTLETSEPLLPVVVMMMVSPSDLSWSTKLSTSLPLALSFRALLGPVGLVMEQKHFSSFVHHQLDHNAVCWCHTGLELVWSWASQAPRWSRWVPTSRCRSHQRLAPSSQSARRPYEPAAAPWPSSSSRPWPHAPESALFTHVELVSSCHHVPSLLWADWILTSLTALKTFSSWESISVKVLIWARLTLSL